MALVHLRFLAFAVIHRLIVDENSYPYHKIRTQLSNDCFILIVVRFLVSFSCYRNVLNEF